MCVSWFLLSSFPPEFIFTLRNGTPTQGHGKGSRGQDLWLSPRSRIGPIQGSSSPWSGRYIQLSCRKTAALCYPSTWSCCCWSRTSQGSSQSSQWSSRSSQWSSRSSQWSSRISQGSSSRMFNTSLCSLCFKFTLGSTS